MHIQWLPVQALFSPPPARVYVDTTHCMSQYHKYLIEEYAHLM